MTVKVDIYWDENLTDKVSSFDWGSARYFDLIILVKESMLASLFK